MIEFYSSLRLSRDHCKKLLRFFLSYSLRTSTFVQLDWSAAQKSAIECLDRIRGRQSKWAMVLGGS